jgi:hypothetical protein
MKEIEQLLERQARWQQSRANLSWAEKLRLAETLRDAALALGSAERNTPRPQPLSDSDTPKESE